MGSDINMKDAAGWTPLTRAIVLKSNIEVIEELLNNNADIFAKDKNGKTALSLAKLEGNECIVDIIFKYEMKIKEQTQIIENHAQRNNFLRNCEDVEKSTISTKNEEKQQNEECHKK
ncbi:unnamed protein product [Nezara viridula]|uniref:Ankyrin repeat protein n=1 Tax=Nezara viridula TaxID=85310 RepID=A0A9P0H7L6_NEZVI|nr:unnamed protein product [Nezara viridula]